MRELKCPRCGGGFTINWAVYASIESQVRTAGVEAELACLQGQLLPLGDE
ncbi:MAG: hypothetical protein IJU72_02330 [Bacteroidales bacterium]|nr:hypothetical protein [Bacteroidales bacterium]